jgi:hypothetical protein
MSRVRAATQWVLATLALLLAGVLVDTARAAPRAGLRRELTPYLPSLRPGTPLQAAVLLQRTDCSGNVRVLDLLHRDEVHPRLHLAVIWFVGPAVDTLAIRAQLPQWTASTPLRHVPGDALHELHRLGHQSTPVLVVLDQESRIRLTTQSPRSLREFAGLRRIVEGLTWIEEL